MRTWWRTSRRLPAGSRGNAASHIETAVAPDIGDVDLDPNRLKQVLYNYLSNAIKFSHERGRVEVRVRPEGTDYFCVEVEDWGIGIKEDDLDRLFIEFQQLDASTAKHYKGTGLGLALTKRIVEAQGGSVGVRTEFGAGQHVLRKAAQNGDRAYGRHDVERRACRIERKVSVDAKA